MYLNYKDIAQWGKYELSHFIVYRIFKFLCVDMIFVCGYARRQEG